MMNQAKQTGARAMQITMLSQVVTPTSATTIVTVAPDGRLCRCELVSVDCLDSMNCMPESLQESQTTVARGMLTRTVIQEISKKGPVLEMEPFPVGKQFQYVAMDAWTAWTEDESLSVGFGSPENSKFLQNTGYPDCIKNGWAGSACFFAPPANNSQDMGTLELEAQPLTDGVDMESLRQDVNAYLDNWQSVPALGHLMTFVHILRIFFNRRSHVQDFCRDRQVTHRNFNSSTDFPLSVSMHIRRADSCSSEVLETKAAPLDSPAQPTNLRKCYNTKVYIDAVQDVQSRTSRPIEVYLSSDHSGSLLEEIRRDFPDMYKNVAAWHVLDYNRTIFQYKGPVEGSEHSSHAILGESAIADLWLLSHGEVFIGHMGSRFGKLGWFLATARYNRFIPFRTVDGHSVSRGRHNMCKYNASLYAISHVSFDTMTLGLLRDR